jgi:hypothetical protein
MKIFVRASVKNPEVTVAPFTRVWISILLLIVIFETGNFGIIIYFIGMIFVSCFVKTDQLLSNFIQGRDIQPGNWLNPNIVKH